MDKVILKATVRGALGKIGSKHLRQEGQIPCVVYKEGKVGVNLQVDTKELWRALHTDAGENAIITMDISDDEKQSQKTVILRETQRDPINEKFLHVDFHEISLKDKLKVNVPIAIKGEAIGVKEEEGVLGQVVWEIEVECLPTDIPEQLDVNVDDLAIGDAIHVKDIVVPENVTLLTDPEQMVVAVHPPHVEEEEVPEGEEGGEGEEGAEPEVIKKGKQDEEGESDGETPAATEE